MLCFDPIVVMLLISTESQDIMVVYIKPAFFSIFKKKSNNGLTTLWKFLCEVMHFSMNKIGISNMSFTFFIGEQNLTFLQRESQMNALPLCFHDPSPPPLLTSHVFCERPILIILFLAYFRKN